MEQAFQLDLKQGRPEVSVAVVLRDHRAGGSRMVLEGSIEAMITYF